jgi:hypothetical protein
MFQDTFQILESVFFYAFGYAFFKMLIFVFLRPCYCLRLAILSNFFNPILNIKLANNRD